MLARRKLYNGGPKARKTANDLGKASYVTSILGIVVAVIIVFLVVVILVSRGVLKIWHGRIPAA